MRRQFRLKISAWRRVCLLIICLCGVLPVWSVDNISSVLERAPVLDPNLSVYPESSLLDCSARLDAPAGKHGFVLAQGGHFILAHTGQRIRFFGVNLAKDSVFVTKPQIDRLVGVFARAGLNLVRIHQIDDAQGVLDPTSSQLLRPAMIDLLDYWVAKLKERGIYLALDLNDYRTFRANDGVIDGEALGRGAKPYAIFDKRMIQLQQEYARQLLVTHINPYTGLCYARDPAVALLELYDENGLFIRRADWATLREPYLTQLQQEWNTWLRKRYGSTESLRTAWTNRAGVGALMSTENLETATVQLPRMDLSSDPPSTAGSVLVAPVRVSAGAQFAYDMQHAYFTEMTTYLHAIGVRIPITAVGAQDVVPDLMATAGACDYIGINFYWDHPQWVDGNEWKYPAYFGLTNPMVENPDYTFPVTVSMAHMAGKPLVVRELGYCSPNPYRGFGMIEAGAYGAFLDIDALILFTYGTDTASRTIGTFDIHLDPLRWDLVTQAGRLFCSGEVQSSHATVGIGYSDVDAFTWYSYLSPLYRLAYHARVVNYTTPNTPHPFDLLVASGRSAGSRWQGERLLLFNNLCHTDLLYQGAATGLEERIGYTLKPGQSGILSFTFNGFGYPANTLKQVAAMPAFSTDDLLAHGLVPMASANADALGFIDPAKKIMGFHALRPELAVRMALDALHNWSEASLSSADLDKNHWVTDTGQVTRDITQQVLRVETPAFQAMAGRLDTAPVETGLLRLTTTTPIGTLTAESLDAKPLADSASLLVTMTSRARNDGLQPISAGSGPKPFRFNSFGDAPIHTDGQPVTTPTHVELAGKLLIELNLQNGTWEYLLERQRALLYLDTPNVTITLPEKPRLVRWHTGGDVVTLIPQSTRLTIPTGVHLTEIIWER